MKEPDKTSSQASGTPGSDIKKQPTPGSAVENRPVDAPAPTKATAGDAKPGIDSKLLGQNADTGAAAAKRDSTPFQTAPTEKPSDKAAEKPAEKPAEKTSDKTIDKLTSKPAPKPTDSRSVTEKQAEAAAASPVPSVTRPDPTKGSDTRSSSAASSDPAVVAPPSAATTTQPQTRVEVRRGGFFPTFLGGVVAAGLGAAACYWAIPHLPQDWRPGVIEAVDPQAQIDAATQAGAAAAKAEFQTQADALGKRAAEAGADAARQALADIPAPSTAAPGAALPPAVADQLADLQRKFTDLSAQVGSQPAAQAASGPAGPSQADLDNLAAQLTQQQAKIDELAARPTVDPATAQQVQTLAKQAEELQQSTQAANRRAQAATAAGALLAAIENAAPRDQALAELQAAGVQVPAVLTGEIPRLDQLRTEFPAAARLGLRDSLDAVAGTETAMGKIGNFLRVQTGARSVEAREGSDPDAILSRANAAVEAGNIAGALSQIATLPQPGQQAMADWTKRAQTWVDANAALTALATGDR